jgi:hypothetical protein
MEEEIKKQIRLLGPSDCPFIDKPYLSEYLSERQIIRLRDCWYDGRVRVIRSKAIKRGPEKGKIKIDVGLRRRDPKTRKRQPYWIIADPAHLVLM